MSDSSGTVDDREERETQDAEEGSQQDDAPAPAENDEDVAASGDGEGGDESSDQGSDGKHTQVVEVAPDPDKTGMDIEKPPRADEMSEDELEEVRQERLAPENRPEGAEVDNTQRTFDTKTGKFEDSDTDADLGPFEDPEESDDD